MKKKAKKILKKEEIAEDWCFVCKDGGLLLVCDYKQCLKAYHPGCVGKDDSFLETGTRWNCYWHSCFICGRSSHFYCYCCPKAVCKHCIDGSEFVHVKGKKGFCSFCLKIALLVEEKKDVDSDGGKVDFKDRETYEFLFMEYWALINDKEGLTVENLKSANARLKMGNNYKSDSDSDEQYTSEEDQLISNGDNMNYMEEQKPKRKRSIGKSSPGKGKSKSNEKEFIGWGSKFLIQFLSSIGKDPSGKLSQHEVTNIINGYIKENNLFHPQKKKQVVCDARLQSVLGRKIVSKHRIFDILEAHFAENLDSSEEDDFAYNSKEMDDDILVPCKNLRKSSSDRVSHKKNLVFNIPPNCLASLVAENIKLIYLRRSLVQELLKQPETFESKVLGSFVRVKSDPNDFFQKNPYQLVQVTGIKKGSAGESDPEIFLQVSAMPRDIRISVLSDDDFSEEECEDLRLKVELGLVKKLTVKELEQKARILHEDLTKHWISRELVLMQNLIDRANEKGWRREMYEHMERKQLLNSSAEQSRLLQEFPTVIPHVEELDEHGDEEGSPKSTLMGTSEIPGDNWESNGTFSDEKKHDGRVSIPKEKQHLTETSALKEPPQKTPIVAPKVQLDVLKIEPPRSFLEENQKCPKPFTSAPKDQSNDTLETEENQRSSSLSSTKQTKPNDFKRGKAKSEDPSIVQLIELSSDDENDDGGGGVHAAIGIQKLEDPESSIWYCLGPNGERKGPHSLSLLKRWSEYSSFALKFKVWRMSQSEENAISLGDAVKLGLGFPRKIEAGLS